MAMLDKEYDVIVIGGGINGLAVAAYLQKSGLKVAVFERRFVFSDDLDYLAVRRSLHLLEDLHRLQESEHLLLLHN